MTLNHTNLCQYAVPSVLWSHCHTPGGLSSAKALWVWMADVTVQTEFHWEAMWIEWKKSSLMSCGVSVTLHRNQLDLPHWTTHTGWRKLSDVVQGPICLDTQRSHFHPRDNEEWVSSVLKANIIGVLLLPESGPGWGAQASFSRVPTNIFVLSSLPQPQELFPRWRVGKPCFSSSDTATKL